LATKIPFIQAGFSGRRLVLHLCGAHYAASAAMNKSLSVFKPRKTQLYSRQIRVKQRANKDKRDKYQANYYT
jgi:glucan phosphoethanolaminetransferase (alkaline phosphatase superfamily)